MKDIELRLVCELMRNSRRSDRELAKTLHVSQPTVSRTRMRLEREGMIDYTGVPNMVKLGYELVAVTFGKRNFKKHPEILQKAKEFTKHHSEIIFAADGNGLGYDRITVTIHKDYSEYSRFMREAKATVGDAAELFSFLISLTSQGVLQPLSLKRFAEQLIK